MTKSIIAIANIVTYNCLDGNKVSSTMQYIHTSLIFILFRSDIIRVQCQKLVYNPQSAKYRMQHQWQKLHFCKDLSYVNAYYEKGDVREQIQALDGRHGFLLTSTSVTEAANDNEKVPNTE